MQSRPWKLEKHIARLQFERLSATLDLTRPAEGLVELHLPTARTAGAALLGVAIPSFPADNPDSLIECYLRGTDLVAAYEESPQWPVRVDASWSATSVTISGLSVWVVQLMVSVRTGLPDSRAELVVQSDVPTAEVLRLIKPEEVRYQSLPSAPTAMRPEEGPGCLLFRLPQPDFSYAEMVHPADFQYDELTTGRRHDGSMRLAHRLFSERLEKGVIRRARVEGVFLPRSDDQQVAAALYTAFAAAEPPLTT